MNFGMWTMNATVQGHVLAWQLGAGTPYAFDFNCCLILPETLKVICLPAAAERSLIHKRSTHWPPWHAMGGARHFCLG